MNGKHNQTGMFSQVLRVGMIAATLASLGGCDDGESLDTYERSLVYYGDCSNWRCGYNTSEINGKSLQELNLDGQPNADGVELVGFLPPAGLLLGWELDVDGDELVARGGLLGSSTLRGPALIGSTLLVRVGGGLVVPVIIAGYDVVDSWASDGAPVPAYALVYADLTEPLLQRSVCKGTLLDPLQASVVILAGERYDLDAKTVTTGQDGWITLACAGSAAAKMALLGYGPNAELAGGAPPKSPAQRQATLKMLTADYCGDGHSYTVDGTPLEWENRSGTVSVDPSAPLVGREAIWTADGALCLDEPRHVAASGVACALPNCSGFALTDGEWASHVVDP